MCTICWRDIREAISKAPGTKALERAPSANRRLWTPGEDCGNFFAMSNGQGSTGNVIAALASFFIPGLGQLIQGRFLPAIGFFAFTAIGYGLWFLIIPAVVGGLIHLWAIIDAALWKGKR